QGAAQSLPPAAGYSVYRPGELDRGPSALVSQRGLSNARPTDCLPRVPPGGVRADRAAAALGSRTAAPGPDLALGTGGGSDPSATRPSVPPSRPPDRRVRRP